MNKAERNLYEFLKRTSDDVRALNADLTQNPAARRETQPGPSTRPTRAYANEDALQIELFRLIDGAVFDYPELALAYHVPNGGKRGRATAGRMKAMGVRRGVPDVQLDVARGPYHGLRIELKMPGKKPNHEQRAWHEQLRRQGYRVEVHTDPADAFRAMIEYLGGKWNSGFPY